MQKIISSIFSSFLLVSFFLVSSAYSQVAISADIRGTYDDNVFLENGILAPEISLDGLTPEQIEEVQALDTTPVDGLEDEDFIYNVSLNISSGTGDYLGSAINGGWELQTGFLIFTEFTENNRFTLDSRVDFNLDESVLPRPFFVNFSSNIASQTVDQSVATNSAARATQVWTTNFRTGIRDYEIASNTNASTGYDFTYSNFLGEFLLQGDRDNTLDQNGSDFLTHRIFLDIDHQLTKAFNTGISLTADSTDFSSADDNEDDIDFQEDNLDRFSYEASWVNSYIVSNKLSLSGSVGVNITRFKDSPEPVTVFSTDELGAPVEDTFVGERTQSGAIFEVGLAYNIEPGSSLNLRANQSRTPNIDGELLTVRNFSANYSKALGDRFSLGIGGNFLMFSAGDNLSNAIDRVEANASISYALTQNTSLTVGYFFSDQNTDTGSLEPELLFQSQDFTSNRFFIGISSGLIGQRS